jgi:hypothetical protein
MAKRKRTRSEQRPKKKRITKYYATYIGPPCILKLSGVGEITRGKPVLVSEKVANALRLSENWDVKPKHEYVEIDE